MLLLNHRFEFGIIKISNLLKKRKLEKFTSVEYFMEMEPQN